MSGGRKSVYLLQIKNKPQTRNFFQKQYIIKISINMKTQTIIELLNTPDAMEHDNALRYINSTMKAGILKKIRTPVFMDENEIWNRALTVFWENISVRRSMFDFSKENAIQRFLYTVCKRQIFNGIKEHARRKATPLDNVQIRTTDIDMESNAVQMELSRNIQILRNYINETEWLVLVHRFFDIMSYEEMSKVMHKTPGGLKNAKCRAIKKIKKALCEDVVLQTYLRFLLNESSGIG